MSGKRLDSYPKCKRGSVSWLLVCWSVVWLHAAGCSQSKLPIIGERSPPPPLSAPEKTKVVVLRLENSVKRNKADTSTAEDRLFGNGIRVSIVSALEQTGRFTVVNNTGPRQVLQRETLTDTGAIKESVRDRLGIPGDAEFLLAGSITTYQLSKESKKNGVEADPLFRESQARMINVDGIVDIAKKVFEGLKPVNQDRVALELWLFDAKTGKRIAITRIEGTPSDSGETLATPMQQAVRGSATKAVNWIADTQTAFRAGTLEPPIIETKKPPLPELKPEKVTGTRPTKPPPARPRPEEKIQSEIEEAEKIPPPAAKTPEGKREDWGSPPSQPAGKVEKSPTQSSEEWGEK